MLYGSQKLQTFSSSKTCSYKLSDLYVTTANIINKSYTTNHEFCIILFAFTICYKINVLDMQH